MKDEYNTGAMKNRIRKQLKKLRREEQLKSRANQLRFLRQKQMSYEMLGAILVVASFFSLLLMINITDSIWVTLGGWAVIISCHVMLIYNKRLRKKLIK